MSSMLALVLVACSLGLSNFGAAIGIGVSGITARRRLEVAVVFGLFETGMPLLGLILGHDAAHGVGNATRWIGGGLLITTGAYAVIQAIRANAGGAQPETSSLPIGRLWLTALALSVDNLAVGFALGTYPVNLAVAALVIGAVSVSLSLVGLELGSRIGSRIGNGGEVVGGLVLIGVGIAIVGGVL
jgi:putative Mn2+ efflux pump MntP